MGKDFDVEKLSGSDNYHTWNFAVARNRRGRGRGRARGVIQVPVVSVERVEDRFAQATSTNLPVITYSKVAEYYEKLRTPEQRQRFEICKCRVWRHCYWLCENKTGKGELCSGEMNKIHSVIGIDSTY
ncbi:hypothetical protein Bhyg_04239 [Pseudolycoriella hygida]|uniref:Uncharacterized protein n=1 Tax=Pseudolycoriella hygida TaxID=35572 RepID=A0A9Q0NEW8_9DIPT|nr:hypothetical protein Bhyg_04239 [Pseudolycoriella hygida]